MQNLTQEEFATAIALNPLVSIDLLVRDPAGRILLGFRNNAPAKDCWFVPGGRIHKGETAKEALRRTYIDELGIEAELEDLGLVQIFTHIYSESEPAQVPPAEVPTVTTQYVVILVEKAINLDLTSLPLAQHSKWCWMKPDDLIASSEVHENVKNYLTCSQARVETKDLLQLYTIYQGALSVYTSIVWAFPAGLLALNGVAIQTMTAQNMGTKGQIGLLVIALFNFAFLQAFFKLVANQQAIVIAIQRVEKSLRSSFAGSRETLIPTFAYSWFTKTPSALIFKWGLSIFAAGNLLFASSMFFQSSALPAPSDCTAQASGISIFKCIAKLVEKIV